MLVKFVILYILGGTFFLFFTIKANRRSGAADSLLGMWEITRNFNRIVFGEIIWILLWLLGMTIYHNNFTLFLGVFPLLMPVITFGSLFLLKFKDIEAKRNKGVKKLLKRRIHVWEASLPSGVEIKTVLFSISKRKDTINGRVIVHMKSSKIFPSVNWKEYGQSLEDTIKHPVIIQLILNNETIYP